MQRSSNPLAYRPGRAYQHFRRLFLSQARQCQGCILRQSRRECLDCLAPRSSRRHTSASHQSNPFPMVVCEYTVMIQASSAIIFFIWRYNVLLLEICLGDQGILGSFVNWKKRVSVILQCLILHVYIHVCFIFTDWKIQSHTDTRKKKGLLDITQIKTVCTL